MDVSARTARRMFLSYRREDSAGHAGRLADHLLDRFGSGSVFMDVESIEAGADFTRAIEIAIEGSDAVLVVMGPGWLEAATTDGRRRLDESADFVRREIEIALRSDVRVIPVLVGGASMPSEDKLPGSIAELARRNAVELLDRRWREDVDALVDILEGRGKTIVGNLPAQPTSFLGREHELAEVTDLLRRDDVRLLSLTGPGGIGKTRLSLQAASKLAYTYPGGAWFVELAALRDHELIAPTIATMLELREGPGSTIEETLERHLRRMRILLVIDNVEHLLPDAAAMLGGLASAAPSLDLLVSSREPLSVRAERVYPVPELAIEDSIGLFVERARAADPSFELADTNGPVVEAICRRLDALPLGIELAAARLRLMSPSELLERIEKRLPMLVGGARDAPERQRTMRATIAWSYDLLDEDERILFARLAVFRGGCASDAAEAVCAATLERMGSLVDKSLLRTEERPPGRTRYRLLETIREFALERLAELPDESELRERHAADLIGLARSALPGLKGKDQDVWLGRLEAELDNVRAALRWSLDEGDPDAALELTSLVWEFWLMHGDVTEGRAWLAEALERADPAPSEARALALAGAGWLACEQGAGAFAASAMVDEILRCSEAASSATRAYALAFLGEFLPDDPVRARSFCEEAVAIARTTGDKWLLAITLNSLAERVRATDLQVATALYEEELRVSREIGDRFNESLCLVNLGEMAYLGGDNRRARECLREGYEIAEERGDRRNRSFASEVLGWVALSEGHHEESEEHFRDSIALARELDGLIVILPAFAGLAAVAAAEGDVARAARLAGAAEALEERIGPVAQLERPPAPHLDEARNTASDVWVSNRVEGRRMSMDAALDYALSH